MTKQLCAAATFRKLGWVAALPIMLASTCVCEPPTDSMPTDGGGEPMPVPAFERVIVEGVNPTDLNVIFKVRYEIGDTVVHEWHGRPFVVVLLAVGAQP